MPLAYRQGAGIICVQKLSLLGGEALNEGDGLPGATHVVGLSRGLQGEHQWKPNVSICPLAVCIVLDA